MGHCPLFFMPGFVPAADLLLFWQKAAKPFLPVLGPSGLAQKQGLRDAWSTTPNPSAALRTGQDGAETRSACMVSDSP